MIIYKPVIEVNLKATLRKKISPKSAQMIIASGNKLFYHTWKKDDMAHDYEIDFLDGSFLLSLSLKLFQIQAQQK